MRDLKLGRGEKWALASAITYALGNVMTRVVSVEGDPLAGSIIRTVPLIALSIIMMVWRRSEITKLMPRHENFMGWKTVRILLIFGLMITPISIFGIYLAFRLGGILIAIPVLSVHPLWAAIFAVPFLGEAFNRRIGAGIITVVIGIILLTYGQQIGVPFSDQWLLGGAAALVTSLSFATGAVFRRYLITGGMDIFWQLGITSTIGTGLLVLILAGLGKLDTLGQFTSTQFWQLMVSGGLSAAGNFTISAAFIYATVASVTTLKSLDTVIASVIAVFFLDEILNLPIGLSIILIVVGVLTVQIGSSKKAVKPVSA